MLTERDKQVISSHCLHIRVATLDQLADAFWASTSCPKRAAYARLRTLCGEGWLQVEATQVLPIRALSGPLVSWQPGDWLCNFGALAWKLAVRWRGPTRQAQVYRATAKAARIFGGRRNGEINRRFQLSHDIGVAAMYFALRRARPNVIDQWIDEERLAPHRRGEKLPDAALGTNAARPDRILEFGGKYGKARLEAFHDDCESRGLPYEIW